ncbi:Plant regulator RWP-RK [Corchorus olitorius]|uniref:Plant regulator RWP-RK n=1 Tax=Corchorus olitorius TaxID=93759 RepID=A0A1R3G385_9ROSI|nr:Plant regulator RWP-RK [Corchorus olitorius]
MEDPSSIVPYNDPFENMFSDDEIMNILEFSNPTLEDLTTQEQEVPFLYSSSFSDQSSDQIDDFMDPLDDPDIRDFFNESNTENSHETTSFGFFGDMSNQSEMNLESQSLNYENSRPVSVWPSEPVPFGCSCCQVLREIIHTNGIVVTKLEIHGRLGMICHAILDQPDSSNQYVMFDFCKKSIEEVKQFLTQYCIERSQMGYIMIKDPLSVFYEAICRERVKNVTLEEIENFYHLPIDEAAKRMEFCPTVLKRICRKYGVQRWPHRKIQSMEKKMSHWTSRLSSNDPQERARAEDEIRNLQRQMAKVGEGAR